MADKILNYAGFAKSVKGSSHEIWLKFLQMQHGFERHTEAGWHDIIVHYGNQPGHLPPVKFVAPVVTNNEGA